LIFTQHEFALAFHNAVNDRIGLEPDPMGSQWIHPQADVMQLYLSFTDIKGVPLKALRGFHRMHLEPGVSQKVSPS
jgi:hypothetical protein